MAPKDGNDKNACQKTGDFLKKATEQQDIFNYTSMEGEVIIWALNATDSQAASVGKQEGVADISVDVDVLEDDAVVPQP